MRSAIIIGAVVIAGGLGYVLWPSADSSNLEPTQTTSAGAALVEVTVPATFSENAQIGNRAFDAKCASCHGTNGAGQDGVGPPLVHIIYEPNHHGDEAFQQAASMGMQGHHWQFGNMPPVDGVTRSDVTMIVAYIRELQRANGIN